MHVCAAGQSPCRDVHVGGGMLSVHTVQTQHAEHTYCADPDRPCLLLDHQSAAAWQLHLQEAQLTGQLGRPEVCGWCLPLPRSSNETCFYVCLRVHLSWQPTCKDCQAGAALLCRHSLPLQQGPCDIKHVLPQVCMAQGEPWHSLSSLCGILLRTCMLCCDAACRPACVVLSMSE